MPDLSFGLEGYPLPAFYFMVTFDPVQAGDTSFQEVTGIGAELELEAVNEGGENRFVHQLPKATKYPRLALKRGIALRISPLVGWCKEVLEEDYDKSKGIETKTVHVSLLNELGVPLRSWVFLNAYPVNWDVEPFNSTKNEVAIEKIELVYSTCQRLM